MPTKPQLDPETTESARSLLMEQKQYELAHDIPFVLKMGKHTYTCHYTKEWVSARISYAIAKCVPNPKADVSELIKLMSRNNTLPSRCVAYLLLGSWWKIIAFHWLYWRILYVRHTSFEIHQGLNAVFNAVDVGFFFQNMILLDQMNTLKKRMSKEELEQLYQERLSLEKKQVS